jgi:hypothetical protein
MFRQIVILLLAGAMGAGAAFAVNPAGAPDDHFLCYKAAASKGSTKFASVPGVQLADGFDPDDFEVVKPVWICAPADNAGEGIVNPAVLLESYKLKAVKGEPKPVARTNVFVVNQINPLGLFVDTKKPDLLLLPTAIDQTGAPPAPDPGAHDVDLYKCYGVKVSKGQPAFPKGIQRQLGAQLTTPAKLFDIKKPKRLCVPASKNGSAIENAAGHLLCYQVKPAKDEPKHTPVSGLYAANDFAQPERLDTKKEAELCVPSILPVCGDGLVNQPSEQCDGADDSACPGECTQHCGCRQQIPFVLDPANSRVQVRGVNVLGVGVDRDLFLGGLSGTIVINNEGQVRPGQLEISVPVTALPPLDVVIPGFGSVATACVFLEEDPELPGSGLAGVGLVNCYGTSVPDLGSPDFSAHQDHCTNGGACDSGMPSGCSGALHSGGKVHTGTGVCVPAAPADAMCTRTDPVTGSTANLEEPTDNHPGICNSPVYGVFGNSGWSPGDLVVTLTAGVDIRGPGDTCAGASSVGSLKGPLTTGTVVSTIMDVFPNIAPAAGKVQALRLTGTAVSCIGASSFTTSGAALVTSAPILDVPLPIFGLADINVGLTLAGQ